MSSKKSANVVAAPVAQSAIPNLAAGANAGNKQDEYTVEIIIQKINQRTGRIEHRSSSQACDLDFEQGKLTVEEAAPLLVQAALMMNRKDVR